MPLTLQRRQLLLAATALAGGGASAQPGAASAGQSSGHPDLALKLIIVGRRKPGTTLAEHRQHIRRVHGELVLRNIAVDPANAPRRYVQNPVFDGTYRAGPVASERFALNRDFVTQIWFPDLAALARARQSAFYLAHLKADEDNFVDQASVVFTPVRERVLADAAAAPGPRVKLFGFVQRASGVAPDAFAQAWRAAAWSRAGDALPLKHAQNDPLPTPAGPPALDGIDECWYADEAGARAGLKRWQAWVDEALVRPGLAAEGSAFALLTHEDVIHAGPR